MFVGETDRLYYLLEEYIGAKNDFSNKIDIINRNIPLFMKHVEDFLDQNPQLRELFKEDAPSSEKNIETQEIEKANDTFTCESNEPEKNSPLNNSTSIVVVGSIKDLSHEITRNVDNEREHKLKDIYRKIVKVTHPDKTIDQILNEFYIKATEFYGNKDFYALLYLCYKLQISFKIDSGELEDLDKETLEFKNKNKFLDTNLTLVWIKSEKKEDIILDYILSKITSKRFFNYFV